MHLFDFRQERLEGYPDFGHILIGIALCGERGVRCSTEHELKRGRIKCPGCLAEYGRRDREDAIARAVRNELQSDPPWGHRITRHRARQRVIRSAPSGAGSDPRDAQPTIA